MDAAVDKGPRGAMGEAKPQASDRNKVGIDVASEVLKECWRSRRCEIDELVHYARICRVRNIMQPYMEAIVS